MVSQMGMVEVHLVDNCISVYLEKNRKGYFYFWRSLDLRVSSLCVARQDPNQEVLDNIHSVVKAMYQAMDCMTLLSNMQVSSHTSNHSPTSFFFLNK